MLHLSNVTKVLIVAAAIFAIVAIAYAGTSTRITTKTGPDLPTGGSPPGENTVLWDAGGDKVLWDAGGDAVLWD